MHKTTKIIINPMKSSENQYIWYQIPIQNLTLPREKICVFVLPSSGNEIHLPNSLLQCPRIFQHIQHIDRMETCSTECCCFCRVHVKMSIFHWPHTQNIPQKKRTRISAENLSPNTKQLLTVEARSNQTEPGGSFCVPAGLVVVCRATRLENALTHLPQQRTNRTKKNSENAKRIDRVLRTTTRAAGVCVCGNMWDIFPSASFAHFHVAPFGRSPALLHYRN